MHLDVVRDRLHRELTSISSLDDEALSRWAQRIGENPEYRVAIWDADGRNAVGDPDFVDAIPASLRRDSIDFSVAAIDAGRFALATRTLDRDGGRQVLLAHDLHHVEEEMTQVSRALLITIPFALTLAAILAFVLATRALAPVDNIRRLAEAITAAKLDARVPVTNPDDELGLLARTLNDMIARLQRSFDEIRRFTADASHELRTALAIIRSDAEIGIASCSDKDQAVARFTSILEETQHLTQLTEQLLLLCREEAGCTQMQWCEVDVGQLVEDTANVMRPLAEVKQLSIYSVVASGAFVRADAARLRQVFFNLIENAVKYSRVGGVIQVSVEDIGQSVVIRVHDAGPGIPADLGDRIFDRFVRGHQATDLLFKGSGLGLSIAKSVVEAHGGTLELRSHAPDPAVFQVTMARSSFPVANVALNAKLS